MGRKIYRRRLSSSQACIQQQPRGVVARRAVWKYDWRRQVCNCILYLTYGHCKSQIPIPMAKDIPEKAAESFWLKILWRVWATPLHLFPFQIQIYDSTKPVVFLSCSFYGHCGSHKIILLLKSAESSSRSNGSLTWASNHIDDFCRPERMSRSTCRWLKTKCESCNNWRDTWVAAVGRMGMRWPFGWGTGDSSLSASPPSSSSPPSESVDSELLCFACCIQRIPLRKGFPGGRGGLWGSVWKKDWVCRLTNKS